MLWQNSPFLKKLKEIQAQKSASSVNRLFSRTVVARPKQPQIYFHLLLVYIILFIFPLKSSWKMGKVWISVRYAEQDL